MDKKPQEHRSETEAGLRSRVLTAREDAMGARELGMDARESASGRREDSLTEREEVARLRDETVRARHEAREAEAARDQLVTQMREANEKLVLAALRAEELTDAANAARLEVTESEERFRTLVTTSSSIMFRADAVGRVRMDPASWRDFTGLEVPAEDEPADQWHWLSVVHPAEREQVREAWTQAAASSTPYAQQHRLRRRDDTYAWVAACAVPIPTGGTTREWIGTLTDISDRLRVDEAREQFIAILGHDLRAPLSVIAMATQLLAHVGLPQREADLVVRIMRSERRMDGMIGALLDFARGRLGGGIPIERARCDLASVCAEAVAEAKQAHPTRAITFETSGDVVGAWDRDRLDQVLSNLLGNALKYGTDPIEVAARDEDDRVTVTVHDSGPGIRASAMQTLFEPFHVRALGSTSGLGLGLYIVSEIVRAHAGTISASSSADTGTTFAIGLPRRPAVA